MVKLPIWATTVTPLSKTIALLMFILLPIAAFYYGTYYQQQMDMQKQQQNIIPTPSPIVSQTVSPSISQTVTQAPINPPNGKISCITNADCPPNYICTQAGPIIYGAKQNRTCWKKGSPMPL